MKSQSAKEQRMGSSRRADGTTCIKLETKSFNSFLERGEVCALGCQLLTAVLLKAHRRRRVLDGAVIFVGGVGAVHAAVAPPVDGDALAGLAKELRGVARVRGGGNT